MLDLISKFILGGSFVVAVSTLAEKGFPQYAGIIMTFPVITMVSFVLVPESRLMPLAKAGLIGLAAAGIFIACFIALHYIHPSKPLNIFGSIIVWFIFLFIYHYWFTR